MAVEEAAGLVLARSQALGASSSPPPSVDLKMGAVWVGWLAAAAERRQAGRHWQRMSMAPVGLLARARLALGYPEGLPAAVMVASTASDSPTDHVAQPLHLATPRRKALCLCPTSLAPPPALPAAPLSLVPSLLALTTPHLLQPGAVLPSLHQQRQPSERASYVVLWQHGLLQIQRQMRPA